MPGFLPSVNGFRFANSWPHVPDWTISLPGLTIPIGDAANGLCGGMSYAVRDFFEAGVPVPSDTTAPGSGPLLTYVANRLLDSFDLPTGPLRYVALMNPALSDHETWVAPFGHGRAWRMVNDEWPLIRADLDSGVLSPLGLVEVKSANPFQLGRNHQVLAYGYDLTGSELVIHLYDPNQPDNDAVTMSLDIGDPEHTIDVDYTPATTVFSFFRTAYTHRDPSGLLPSAAAP